MKQPNTKGCPREAKIDGSLHFARASCVINWALGLEKQIGGIELAFFRSGATSEEFRDERFPGLFV